MTQRVIALAGLFCVATTAVAEEKYDLRGPDPKAGQAVKTTSELKIKNGDLQIFVGEQSLEGKADINFKSEEVREMVAVDGEQVTKARTTINKGVTEGEIRIFGQKNDITEHRPLAGFVVKSERTKDGWDNKLERGDPDDEQKKALKDFSPFMHGESNYPKEKVAVGHEWEVTAEKWFNSFGGDPILEPKGKVKKTLIEVKEIDGEKIAIVKTTVDVTGRVKDEDQDMKIALKGTEMTEIVLQTGLEKKSTLKGEMSMSGTNSSDGEKRRMSISGPIEGTGTAKYVVVFD